MIQNHPNHSLFKILEIRASVADSGVALVQMKNVSHGAGKSTGLVDHAKQCPYLQQYCDCKVATITASS